MSLRFALAGLSLVSVFVALDFAQADQVIPATSQSGAFTSCQSSEGGVRCTHFQGYVIVRPAEAALPVVKPDAVLSANRLYLPASDDKTP